MKVRTTKVLFAACTSALLCAGPADAQPRPNSHEIQGSAGFFHAQGADAGTVNADASYGYYLGDQAWQVGVNQGLNWNIIDDADDVWTATTIPFVNYHFGTDDPDNRFIPFLGVFAGGVWNDEDATGTVGPRAGIKNFLTESTFVGMNYRYEWFFDDLDLGDITDERSDGNHVVSIALGYNWGGKGR